MILSIRTTLITILLLATGLSPAMARMTIGVTPETLPGAAQPANLGALEQELTSRLGEPVQLRTFASESEQLDWLIRYRELDAALVSRSLLRTLPDGTLLPLVDLPGIVAVTHPGADPARQEALGQALRSLAGGDSGRRLLGRLNGPVAGKDPQASPPVKPAVVRAIDVIPPPSAPPSASPPPPVTPPSAPAVQAPAAPAVQPPATAPASSLPPVASPAKQPATTPAATSPAPVPASPAESAAPRRTGLLLVAALAVLIGISVKVALLVRHWRNKTSVPAAPPAAPAAESFTYPSPQPSVPPTPAATTRYVEPPPPVAVAAPAAPAAWTEPAIILPEAEDIQPAEPESAIKRPAARRKAAAKGAKQEFPSISDERLLEQGKLGRTKVPALLKRCAEMPQPIILRVRSEGSETCLHFAAGQLCHAYTRNLRSEDGPSQWGKLGYLMVRDGLITEAQCDQAFALIESQAGLRFADALRQAGALDLEALRHILARQAKTAVFALILFTSGEFRIELDNGEVPAEESIALQIEPLIREASHHQAEWTAIRKVLPSLATLLDFSDDGREKLEQVRLSTQQQELLARINGQNSLGILCGESTMMDYEACRFLYLMVKAGVLQVVPAA